VAIPGRQQRAKPTEPVARSRLARGVDDIVVKSVHFAGEQRRAQGDFALDFLRIGVGHCRVILNRPRHASWPVLKMIASARVVSPAPL